MKPLKRLERGTHSYVGALPCGCGCSIVCEMKGYKQAIAKDVAEMLARGLVVRRLEQAAAVEAFGATCANYPHEEWQHRIVAAQAARRARESATALAAVDPQDGDPPA